MMGGPDMRDMPDTDRVYPELVEGLRARDSLGKKPINGQGRGVST